MKYCAQCGSEFVDTAVACSDCGSKSFSAKPQQGAPEVHPVASNSQRFVVLTTVDDPLSARQFQALLETARIPVTVREQQGGTVDRITDGVLPFWELSVPENLTEEASRLLLSAKSRLDAEAEEAARAAEEEAMGNSPT